MAHFISTSSLIDFLEFVKQKSTKEEFSLWGDETPILSSDNNNKELFEQAENGLEYWKERQVNYWK